MKRLDRECVCVLDRKGVEVKGRIEEGIGIGIGKRQKVVIRVNRTPGLKIHVLVMIYHNSSVLRSPN